MADPKATKTTIVVVNEVTKNQYGDILFTDKEGNNYKVSNKRADELGSDIVPGYATELQWSVYMNREYISGAKLVKDGIPKPPEPEVSPPVKTPVKSVTEPIDARGKEIERNMAYKEIGELLRCGFIDENNPADKALLTKYKNWLYHTMGIDVTLK